MKWPRAPAINPDHSAGLIKRVGTSENAFGIFQAPPLLSFGGSPPKSSSDSSVLRSNFRMNRQHNIVISPFVLEASYLLMKAGLSTRKLAASTRLRCSRRSLSAQPLATRAEVGVLLRTSGFERLVLWGA